MVRPLSRSWQRLGLPPSPWLAIHGSRRPKRDLDLAPTTRMAMDVPRSLSLSLPSRHRELALPAWGCQWASRFLQLRGKPDRVLDFAGFPTNHQGLPTNLFAWRTQVCLARRFNAISRSFLKPCLIVPLSEVRRLRSFLGLWDRCSLQPARENRSLARGIQELEPELFQ